MTTIKKILLPLVAITALVLPASAMAAPKSKFRFGQATYVASEGQGTLSVTVTRSARGSHGRSKTNQASSVDWSITGGTATAGADYTVSPAPGRLTFASGETTKTLTFTINEDSEIEGLESINLGLSGASSNALITQPRTSQVLIADDDGPTQISLVPASQSVNESSGSAQLFAVRSGDITGTSTVHYATADGSAVAPGDYTATSGDFTFNLGDFSKTISVPIIDDTQVENPETFDTTLSNVTGATFVNGDSSQTATTTIVDNDSPPVFALDASSYSVNENGSVDVTVQRLGNANAPAPVSANDVFDVNWATADGSATNPADYFIPAGEDQQLQFDSTDDAETITIAANSTDAQVALADDSIAEGDETFALSLASAAIEPGGSGIAPSIGSPSSSTVTIHDNDTPGGTSQGTGGTSGTGGDSGNQLVLGAREPACGLTVKTRKTQRLLKQKGLVLKLRSAQNCKVSLATLVKQVRRHSAKSARLLRFKGKKASLSLEPGKAKTVEVRFSKRTLKAISKALRARTKLVATVTVTARDSASHVTRKTLKITLRR
jgi:Calx-beta domain